MRCRNELTDAHAELNDPKPTIRSSVFFLRILSQNRFDVVVAAHVLAGSAVIHAAKRCSVPVVFDLKDWFPDSAAAYFKNRFLKDLVRRSVWEITRKNLSGSDCITTVSPALVGKLSTLGFSAGLITNGVDTDLFRPMSGSGTRAELGIGPEEFVIGKKGAPDN